MFFRSVFSKLNSTKRYFSAAASELPQAYSKGVQLMHWTMGGSMIACVGLVLLAQDTKDKKKKGDYMFYHKSFGLLSFGLLFPRLLLRLTSKIPGPVPGTSDLMHKAATASHYLMYAFITGLPVTGVVMGAYSGYGLPFFFTTFASIKKDGDTAKAAYEAHKVLGQAFEYFLPLHVSGALYHVAAGHSIMGRILSGAAKASKAA